MKHLITSLFLTLLMSPTLWAQAISDVQQQVPIEFSAFSCVEQTFGNNYRTLRHDVTAPVETILMEEWGINNFISATAFQVTSARYEGDMILVIEGHEINYSMGTSYKSLKFKMATTVGENHSVLEQPEHAVFSCSFLNE